MSALNVSRGWTHLLLILCGYFVPQQKKEAAELLNQPDNSGCTPMHYATREGNIKSVQGLIDLGATVNLKNKDKQSPLHFAAK